MTPLHHSAARLVSVDIFQYLIKECNCDPKVADKEGMTPLHYAAARVPSTRDLYLIKQVHYDTEIGGTPFDLTVAKVSTNVLRYLINECNCDPLMADKKGMTPLHHAAATGPYNILWYLINERNCDPMVADEEGMTPLHYAAARVPANIFELLINEFNCDPTVANKKEMTPLHHLVYSSKFINALIWCVQNICKEIKVLDLMKYLINECGCDPMVTDKEGMTPLHHAAARGYADVLQYLINECNCDPMVTDERGMIPLHHAGSTELLQYLIHEFDPIMAFNRGLTPLHHAATRGSTMVLRYLINECNCDPMVKDKEGMTVLHHVAARKSLDALQYLINKCQCDPTVTDERGMTPLHHAAARASTNVLQYLIGKYCDAMVTDDVGTMNVLHYLSAKRSVDVLRYLISKCNCDQMVADKEGMIPLHHAAASGSTDVLRYLINECNCDPMVTDKKGLTPLHYAAAARSVSVLQFLINECNCDAMVTDKEGMTPLHHAAARGISYVVQYLIDECIFDSQMPNEEEITTNILKYLINDCNCDPLVTDQKEKTSLHHLVTLKGNNTLLWCLFNVNEKKVLLVLQYLINECNCNPMVTGKKGMTPLHFAAAKGCSDVFQYLINECNCDPMVVDWRGMTPLHHAATAKELTDVLRYLINECNCDPMMTDKEGMIPLHYAAASSSIDVLQYLINECNCDPMVADKEGVTPLHSAAANSATDVLQYLINDCNCNPMMADKEGKTALHYAAVTFRGSSDVLKYLVDDCHCDLMQVTDKKGKTPLQLLVMKQGNNTLLWCVHNIGQKKLLLLVLQYLINECKCDPMVTDKEGMTPLHHAAAKGLTDALQYLINECHCDLKVTDTKGMTPLHHAAAKGSTDVLRYLINEHNCDLTVSDNKCMTPLHFAMQQFSVGTVEYLLSTGKCNPLAKASEGQTPLQLANSTEFGKKYLLPLFNMFGQIKTSHPVDSYVNILLLGNAGAGKSTLNQVITETATGTFVLGSYRTVKGVELCTAGIVPTKLQHKQLGNIILHDFAGHSEYYSSHTAVIENLLQGSAGVFVLVLNIMESEALKHLQQWLTVVRNEAQKALGQCRIIVVASHVDEMTGGEVAKRKKVEEIQEIITERCGSEEVFIVSLDCRKLGGAGVTSFLSTLSSACQSIRSTSGRNLTLYCHMMYGLLEDGKQNVFTLSDIGRFATDNNNYVVPIVPKEEHEVLFQLHSTGLICLLKSEDEVWVVVNKQILLAEVNGILFAPKTFKQHRTDIASNTGIITVSTLSQLFSDYDTNMLICFLKNVALCQEIHPHFMEVTNLHQLTESTGEKLLFFPALLDIGKPDVVASQVYQFGWCLQCTKEHHFFPPRYFHVLSLQLAYKLASPRQSDTCKLNRQCTFWRNGLHWFNGHGIGTLVEMVNDSQCVLVLMSSEEGYRENMVSARRDVIGKIMSVYKESCPSLEVEEFIIDPQEIVYPIDDPTERTMYGVKDVIECVREGKPFVGNISSTKQRKLKELLPDERLEDSNTLSLLGGPDVKEQIDTLTVDDTSLKVTPSGSKDKHTTTDTLRIKDLDDIIEVLNKHQFPSSNWRSLGLQLGLYYSTLKDIDEKCRGDPQKCLTECLAAWLYREDKVMEKRGGPSWLSLASGLDAIREHRIAAEIRKL